MKNSTRALAIACVFVMAVVTTAGWAQTDSVQLPTVQSKPAVKKPASPQYGSSLSVNVRRVLELARRTQAQRSLKGLELWRVGREFDRASMQGKWEGWVGSTSAPGSIQRCEVSISVDNAGGLVATLKTSSLGMTIADGDGGLTPESSSLQRSIPGAVSITVIINGRTETARATVRQSGSMTYLSWTSQEGNTYQFWRLRGGSPMMQAFWH